MTEGPPEQSGTGGGGMKIMGLPAPVVVIGGAVVAYLLFFRSSSSPSTSGSGTSTTGNITLNPGTTSVNISAPVSVTKGVAHGPAKKPRHGTHNPQPKPKPKPKTKTTSTPVQHKATPAKFVMVAKWPGKGSGGLAQWNTTLWGISQRTNTSIAELLKLNPQIKNPNLVYPGEKIRYR